MKLNSRNETPDCEFIASIRVAVAPSIIIGNTGAGIREVFPIIGGTLQGARLNGKVIPGGADWALQRQNGGYHVSARYIIQLTDGTLVAILNAGLVYKNGDGNYGGRTVAEFEVADGPHAWLRESIFIGTLFADDKNEHEVSIELWRVT